MVCSVDALLIQFSGNDQTTYLIQVKIVLSARGASGGRKVRSLITTAMAHSFSRLFQPQLEGNESS